MRVLYLGPPSDLVEWIRAQGDHVVQTELSIAQSGGYDVLVSYGYRHILRGGALSIPAVNLHISMLPWNRGADPNFWSWVDGTPKGATLHYMDEGLDTGDIIEQREVAFGLDETLATSYAKLQSVVQALFKKHWAGIKSRTAPRVKQVGRGSYHARKDKLSHPLGLLVWDTRCREFDEYAQEAQMTPQIWA